MSLEAQKADALYRRFGPLVYARCKRLLKDASAAEDATQEVFVRAFRHIHAAPDDQAALRWLYCISTHYCLNALRDAGRRPTSSSDALPDTAGQDLGRVLEDRQLALALVRHAPEKLSAPALLHWVDGIDQGRVAEMLEVSRRTVINRLGAFTVWAQKFVREEKA